MAIVEINVREFFADAGNVKAFDEMCAEQWQEVESHRTYAVEPAWDAYADLQDAGHLIFLCAYDGHEVVGYAITILAPDLHYGCMLIAGNDAIFVKATARKRCYGLKLMREVEKIAQAHGAKEMVWQAKAGSSLNTVLRRRGCRMEEIVYIKEL